MDLFDPRLIEALDRVARMARRLPGGGILGRAAPRWPAGGTEPSGTRDYSPGDDYRHIDWRLCARHDELLTRQFFGQAHPDVHILLDVSASMGLGTPAKFEVARQITAALGYAALSSGRHVGVASFGDTVLDDCASVDHVARLLRWLSRLKIERGVTDLRKAASLFVRVCRRRGLALVVSDFYDCSGFAEGLNVLRHEGWEPRLIQVYDPAEAEPELLGDVALRDVESGTVTTNTVTEITRKRYRMAYREHRRALDSQGMPAVHVDCTIPLEEQLLVSLGGRGTGARRSGAGEPQENDRTRNSGGPPQSLTGANGSKRRSGQPMTRAQSCPTVQSAAEVALVALPSLAGFR